MLACGCGKPAGAGRDAILNQHRVMTGNQLSAGLLRRSQEIRSGPPMSGVAAARAGVFRSESISKPAWSFMNYRVSKWAVLAAFALMLVSFAPKAHAQSASKLYKQGQVAEAKDDIEAAYNDYLQAFQKNPKDERYKVSYERLRFPVAALHVKRGEKLRDQGDMTGAVTEFLRAL